MVSSQTYLHGNILSQCVSLSPSQSKGRRPLLFNCTISFRIFIGTLLETLSISNDSRYVKVTSSSEQLAMLLIENVNTEFNKEAE